jgi:hypothetical protein
MRLRPRVIFVLAVCFAVSGGAAWADGVPVENASFETTNALTSSYGIGCDYDKGPIPDWTIPWGSAQAGSWQLSSTFLNLPLPDGNIVAYSDGNTISQILGVTVQSDLTYTLSVDIDHRLDGNVAATQSPWTMG